MSILKEYDPSESIRQMTSGLMYARVPANELALSPFSISLVKPNPASFTTEFLVSRMLLKRENSFYIDFYGIISYIYVASLIFKI